MDSRFFFFLPAPSGPFTDGPSPAGVGALEAVFGVTALGGIPAGVVTAVPDQTVGLSGAP